MIIIKIPITFTIPRLEAVTANLRLYLMRDGHAYANGKVNGSREDTLAYQVVLKLTDKLLRKLSDKKLAPNTKRDFKIKLHYHEAFFLLKALLNNEFVSLSESVYIDNIIKQIDQQL